MASESSPSQPKASLAVATDKHDLSSLSGISSRSGSSTSLPGSKDSNSNTAATHATPYAGPSSDPAVLEKIATARSAHGCDPSTIDRTATREDGSEYPSGAKLGLIVLALCLAVFLMALDNSIITTAIPKISDDFNSLADVGWYGSAYLLTQASLQLLFGRFYTFLSVKWTFITAISIFELGSLICGVAPNSVTLIVGRAIAGLGAAGIFSGGLIILAHSLPLHKRPLYTGLLGGMYGIASVAGPLIGGAFTDHATWRWCFYINLPIGGVTLAVIAIFYRDTTAPTDKHDGDLLATIRKFDPLGNAIFMPAIICLLLALQWGGVTYPWSDGRIIALFVLSGVLIAGFIVVQFRSGDNATVPIRIIRNRSVWASGVFAFSMGASFFTFIYYVPLWFQAVQGVSAVESGIRNLPMVLSNVLGSILAGALVTTFGYYAPFMIACTVLLSIGAGLMTTWTPGIGAGAWIGYQIIVGMGPGFGFQQPLMAVQTVLPMSDVATGTALVVFLQSLGGALFLAVGQTVFTNRLAEELVAHLPGVNPSVILMSGATNLQHILDPTQLVVAIEAYNTALTTTFYVAVGMAIATLIGSATIEWKSVKGKNVEMAMA